MKHINYRRDAILKHLKHTNSVSVSNLVEEFGVSGVTVRKDLEELEKMGFLKRTHGGAISVRQDRISIEPTLEELSLMHQKQKLSIAAEAFKTIAAGDAILIDASTTAFELARMLSINPPDDLTVITTSVNVSMEIAKSSKIQLIQIGGNIRSNMLTVMGPIAATTLRGLHADKAFIGVNGIDAKFGLSTQNILECEIKRLILEIATTSYVLADNSKFGCVTLGVIAPVNHANFIITDNEVDEACVREIEETGAKVIKAGSFD